MTQKFMLPEKYDSLPRISYFSQKIQNPFLQEHIVITYASALNSNQPLTILKCLLVFFVFSAL